MMTDMNRKYQPLFITILSSENLHLTEIKEFMQSCQSGSGVGIKQSGQEVGKLK